MIFWILSVRLQLLQVVLVCAFCLVEIIMVHIFIML